MIGGAKRASRGRKGERKGGKERRVCTVATAVVAMEVPFDVERKKEEEEEREERKEKKRGKIGIKDKKEREAREATEDGVEVER